MNRRHLQVILTVLFSILALYLALRGINFQDVRGALGQMDWKWLLLTVPLVLATLVIRAQRWRILLGLQISLWEAFGLINIGYLISGILPLRAGDPARAVGASLRSPVSAIAALSTVVVERVLDMLVIVLILVLTLPFVPGLRSYLTTGQVNTFLTFEHLLVLSGILSLGIMVALILLALFPEQTEEVATRVLRALRIKNPGRWLAPLRNILDGLVALSSPRAGLAVALWTLLLWATTLAHFFVVMWGSRAFIAQPTPLKSAVAMWSSAFGMVFPATGGIGSFHFAVREALLWGFDVSRESGFAYALVVHAISYLMGIILGAVAISTWGLSLSSLISKAEAETERS